MQILISEIRSCMKLRLHMPAIISCLTIPDAAAAVEYGSVAPSKRYPRWFDSFVDVSEAGADGALAWALRNAVMHETSMNWRLGNFGCDRVVFITSQESAPFQNITFVQRDTNDVKVLDLTLFVSSVLSGAQNWLRSVPECPEKVRRLDGLMQTRPHGLPRFVGGLPVIA